MLWITWSRRFVIFGVVLPAMSKKVIWTNESVLAFAGEVDPVTAIEVRARSAVLAALDRGWNGPPFDPIRLADLLNLNVEARADIPDARTILGLDGQPLIQFNPTRPRGRVRFSVAHEIAHTFFSDWKRRVRNRSHERGAAGDNWQLEMLCNIAAAEIIMPIGSFKNIIEEDLNIERLMNLQKKYDVSSESIIIRAIKLTSRSAAMFTASRVHSRGAEDVFRIDYSIPSSSWRNGVLAGTRVDSKSVLGECTAVGYTARAVERWFDLRARYSIECVGLPPYPGSPFPRIGGIISPCKGGVAKSREIDVVHGNALEPRGRGPRIIAHIVNDKTPNWGGGGFAAALRRLMPEVQSDFKQWARESPKNLELGNVRCVGVDESLSIVSMIAQRGYGPSSGPRIRYWALSQCLEHLAAIAKLHGASIHMPPIGTGNAGGSWDIILELLIQHLLQSGLKVTVYDLPPANHRVPVDGFLAAIS